MKTSIVILTLNKLDYTKQCIESIRQFTEPDSYEIIVVDNHSTDGTVEWLAQQQDIRLIANERNMGFPAGCNQGIAVATGDNILLLNNDTIVTRNWLTNLLQALYSSDDIGAVGPVTNNLSYYQTIPVEYESLADMHQFAASHNIANPDKWEPRVKLVGYCMLIKREVIDKIGTLDERFTPGNFEDDDYSFRMLLAGYKLLLCKDTFIHHYGSVSFRSDIQAYNSVLDRNRRKFIDKWQFDPVYSSNIRFDMIGMIDQEHDQPMRILEVGCGTGATLLKIKDVYPQAELFGIELNEAAAGIAATFAHVKASDIEQDLDFPDNYFDYVIFADVLEHLYDPWRVVKHIRKYISDRGKLLVSVPNVMHFSLIRSLLHGRWEYADSGLLDRTHLRFFTLHELTQMFSQADYYNLEIASNTIHASEQDELWIDQLTQLTHPDLRSQYEVYQYLIKAHKNEKYSSEKLKLLLRRIENDIEVDESTAEIIENLRAENIRVDDIIDVIQQHIYHKDTTLNKIAVPCFNNGVYFPVIPLLEKSLEINPDNADTLYNLGYILYSVGEEKAALHYLQQITAPDEEVLELIQLAERELANEPT